MTWARARRLKLTVLVGSLALLLLLVWGSVRTVSGIQQIRLANDNVRSLESRYEALQGGSLPDIALLQGRIAQVKEQLRGARSQLTPLLQLSPLFGWVPGVGPELRSAQDMLDLGESLAQASQDLLAGVDVSTAHISQGDIQLLQGSRFNEDVFRSVAEGGPLFQNALLNLKQATTTLERLESRDLSPGFQEMLTSARKITPSLETFARTGLAMSQHWESFLGYDGPRSYLLVAQNSDELRASGGFIPGAWVLTLDGGEIVRLQFWDTEDVDALSSGPPLPPEGLLQSLWAGAWLFRDAGWYPDFPTSASAMEQIFQLGQGISVDGVIAFDQWAVQGVLETLGPIILPTGEVLDSDSYIRILEEKTDALGQEFMDTVLETLLNRLREQGGDQELVTLLSALNQSLNEKHVLMAFHDQALQEVAEANGWSGALEDVQGDYLMVVDSNVGFSKVNRSIAQSVSYTVDLRADGESQARLDLLYTNRSSGVSPDACDLQSSTASGRTYLAAKNTCYWDYLRVYVPEGGTLLNSSPFPMPQGALYRRIGYNDIEDTSRSYAESGKSVFAGFFNLEVGESRGVAFEYTLPAQVVQKEKGRLTYTLFLQKQPGTGSIPVGVTVRLPSGYCARYSIPSATDLGSNEVQFKVNLNSDKTLKLNLERRANCRFGEEPLPTTVDILPKGRTRTAFASVVVEPATEGLPMHHVQASPQGATLTPGQRFLFTAVALDVAGRPVQGAQFRWWVNNPAAGTVSSSGLFTAGPAQGRYVGAVEVQATSAKGTVSATITIEIVTRLEAEARLLDSVVIYPSEITVKPGANMGLGALGWDVQGRFVQNLRFDWSMADPSAGSVNQLGFFKASPISGRYPNAVQVIVSQDTPNGVLESRVFASVTVSDVARQGVLSQVIVGPRSIVLTPEQRFTLSARAFDESGRPVKDVSFAWEVTQPAAGSIERPGYFVAGHQAGRYPNAIQAVATQQTPGGIVQAKTTITVTVEPPVVVGDLVQVQMVPREAVLKPGQRLVFSALGLDSDGSVIQGGGKWEVVESDAGSISSSGAFKAGSKPGTYKDAVRVRLIQDKEGEKRVVEAYATVNIVGPLDRVTVAKPVITLEAGQSAWVYAVGYDANGLEVPFLQLRWSMENSEAGSMTPSGLFTAAATPGSYENAIRVTAVETDTR
ncbi:MAG: DUF4012 domain-containing protein [Chloroflexi bacterium]|nr:DUF4012 domain-containing protein [Chloroflexota bacterium]